jgi:hypothetical protein
MTTCGYQFIRKDADSTNEFDDHFLFDGVGVAVKLCHHAGVAYYGHLVAHRTAVPLMRSSKKKKHIFMPHLDNGHIVFAWGGS